MFATTPLRLSQDVYRLLLVAYPPAFREEYGEEMARLFRDSARAIHRERGLAGLARLWVSTMLDLAASAARERVEEGWKMSRDARIRWGGLGGIAAGLLWTVGVVLGQERGAIWPGFATVSLVLIAGGLAGLHARLPDQPAWIRGVGTFALILGGIGASLLVLGWGLTWLIAGSDALWSAGLVGGLVLLAAAALMAAAGCGAGAPSRWSTGMLLLGALLMFPATQYNWGLGIPWLAFPFGLAWLWVGLDLILKRAPLSRGPAALA